MIRDAAKGDARAREAFAGAYLPVVRSYLRARWRGGALLEHVDDAVQDVFMACLAEDGALARLDPEGAGRFRTWLYAVTRNIARRHEERRQGPRGQEDALDSEAQALAARDATLSVVFDRSWARAMTRRAAQRMQREASTPEERRRLELLRQRFEEGLSIREIAAETGEEPARLHKDYARAREWFKECLRREVAEHGGRNPAEVERECAELLERL
ncbi:MAG: sigma-70 family RNA polymerase sigma factor [Planctomycetota bacterium]